MAPRANWKGFSEARPRGRSASFTAMHTSAIGPGVRAIAYDQLQLSQRVVPANAGTHHPWLQK